MSVVDELEDILDNNKRLLETNRKLLDRVKQLEGFIKTIVDENPTIFCCNDCIPNAPNPPRHIVDVFRLGLENECECKENE